MSDQQPVLDPRLQEFRSTPQAQEEQEARRTFPAGESQRNSMIAVRLPPRDGRKKRLKRRKQQRDQQQGTPAAATEDGSSEPTLTLSTEPSFGNLAATVASKSQDQTYGDPSARVQSLLGQVEDDEAAEEMLRPLFCQMNELVNVKQSEQLQTQMQQQQQQQEWRQAARWIKFEEDVEEGGMRWSKPHVASLSLFYLFELHNALCAGEIFLESEAQSLEDVASLMADRLVLKNKVKLQSRDELQQLLQKKHWNLHEKRLVRSPSSLGSKIRSFADIGKRNSSKDLEKDSQQQQQQQQQQSRASLRVKNSSSIGLQEMADAEQQSDMQQSPSTQKFDQSFMRKVPPGAETANILVGTSACITTTVAAFIRLRRKVQLPEITEVPVASRFVCILLGPAGEVDRFHELGRCMGTLMADPVFRDVAYLAKNKEDLLAGVDEFLKFCIILPPNEWDPSIRIEPPKEVPSQESRKQAPPSPSITASPPTPSSPTKVDFSIGEQAPSQPPQSPSPTPAPAAPAAATSEEEGDFDDSLERTGRLFGGLILDVKRKAPFFLSDFKDALHVQTIGAFFFIYFACLTPIVTFGGLLNDVTEGYLGAMESIVSGAVCGVTFSLLAGQPLTILGSTGPVLIFETIVFKMCKEMQWDYLAFRLWIGVWIFLILLLIVAFDLSALVKYITRFTEESFAALIAMIFIVQAIKKQLSIGSAYPIGTSWQPDKLRDLNCSCALAAGMNDSEQIALKPGKQFSLPAFTRQGNATDEFFLNHSALIYWDWDSKINQKACVGNQGEWVGSGCGTFAVPDVFLFSCLLFIGTYALGYGLKAMRNSRFFPNRVRALINDFAIMIAIVSMTAVDMLCGLHTPKLEVPQKFSPTLGYGVRGWLVTPFGPRGQNPVYTVLVALLPALLATILVFMDQQITAVIVNRKENKLRKGVGYHLDLLIVAVLIAINSVLGIPWFVAATVLSINHVMSLKIESESAAPGERPRFLGCRENRLTGTLIFVLIGLSIFLTPVLKHIPMPVLYGVFLFMGVSSLRGVQLVQRIALFIMPQKYQPDYKFLRHVKLLQVHKFTLIQIACLVLLWAVKAVKQTSILFPVMVLAICFVRKLLDYLFSQHELKWLDNIMPEFSLKPNLQLRGKKLQQLSEKNRPASSEEAEAQTLLSTAAPEIFVDPPSGRSSLVLSH